jgi:hypothetical protein
MAGLRTGFSRSSQEGSKKAPAAADACQRTYKI